MPSPVSGGGPAVTFVHACLRGDRGGSPAAVWDETGLSDDERRTVPALLSPV